MALDLESLTGDEPREVAIGDLEKEISELWRSATKGSKDAEAVLRAASLTLVVYVESSEAAEEVRTIANSLCEQNPSRVIILMAQPEAKPDGLRSWISAQCKSDEAVSGRKQIRGEQIAIRAAGAAVPDLGSVALPLTLSGLPVYLWWRAGRLAPPEYFQQLFRIASHVLVDSARFENAESDLVALSGFVREKGRQLAFVDLNWARLTPWRELISQCFDNPRVREYVHRIKSVRIEYESESPRRAAQEAQALLIAGWLASRLKWQPAGHGAKQRAGARSLSAKSPQGPVEIQLAGRAFEGSGEGVCFSIALEASGKPPASFHLERGLDGRSVVTRAEVRGTPPVSRTVRLEVLEEAELLNGELQLPGRDRVFEEALDMIARCLES